MKIAISLLGLVLCSSAFVKRDVGTTLFASGKEYIYDFEIHSTTASSDYVTFASAYKIVGDLHIQNSADGLHVQLQHPKFGAYNGPYDFLAPPTFTFKSYDQQLNALTQPFTVQVTNGLATGITVNKNIDKWAANIQRGIASALQLKLSSIDMTKADAFTVEEDTVNGHCDTDYTVIPEEDNNHAPLNKVQVRKYRSHANCKDTPLRIRAPGIYTQKCSDFNSRDVLNQTGFATYDLAVEGGSLVAKKIRITSELIYNIMGVDGYSHLSGTEMTLTLTSSNAGSVPATSNPQAFSDLKFVFENDLSEDEDLKTPQPFFFHHKGLDLDTTGQNKAADVLIAQIKKIHNSLESATVYNDTKEFHKVSPFALTPFVTALDYQHLTDAYNKMKGGDETENKLFLDALVMAGTGPSALVVRDIAATLGAQDTVKLMRIMAPLPNYIRNPTENLLKEFESLIKPDNTKPNGRIIEFAFASMIGRTCKISGCTKTGLLDKWVKYWSDKIVSGTNFDDKTQAVIALRNINLLPSAQKLLTVLQDKNQERSIRSAAMSGLKALLKSDPKAFKLNVLPIFHDTSEDSELRNTALQWTLLAAPEESIFNQVAYSTWFEKDPEVKNYVQTLFQSISGTTKICWLKPASWAKTASQFLAPWVIKGKHSGLYISDYHDDKYNFGHATAVSVQKSGTSLLPRTVVVKFSGEAAGYSTNYLSLFVRMEGVGKTLAGRIMSMTTGVVDFEDIKDVLNKIGVQERTAEPLRIEIALMIHNRVIAYHAADQSTITTIPTLIKKVSEMKTSTYDKEYVRMMLIDGVTTERPNELGIPVSTISAVSALAAIHIKGSPSGSGTTTSRNMEMRLQFNMHAISSVNNHLPQFGTAHSVEAVRTLRARVPRKITIGFDMTQKSLNFVMSAPTIEDPVMAAVHATVQTAIHSDTPAALNDQTVIDLLHQTCPACEGATIVSKGEKYRETRKLGSGYKYKSLEGVSIGAKYFDCEKIHSRVHVFRQLRKFFGPENKNVGGRFGEGLTTVRLGIRYMLQSLFFSPPTETCGMKVWYKQDLSAKSVFDKIEGQAKVKVEQDSKDKLGMKVMVKSSLNFKYIGEVPKNRALDMTLALTKTGLEKLEVKTKMSAKDESTGKGGVLCVDLTSTQSSPSDFFSYEGDSEPTYERNINIAWSKDVTKDPTCPANSAGIKINRKSHRSQAQKDEATADVWPYKQCRDQKNSPKFPGTLTPATEQCLWAVFKQTQLRESNITINYKLDQDARKRWRFLGIALQAMLLPYSTDVDGSDDSHSHTPTTDGLIQGKLGVDVTIDDDTPEANIHWEGSQGEDEHYEHVDMNFLPGMFKRPVHSRFSELMYRAFDYGMYGYCDVTNKQIQTYDNVTYSADLSECYTLLTGDCSDKPRFIVLGKKIGADKLGVKVVAGDHTYEINDMNNIIIDGKSTPITTDKLVFDESKLFKVYKHDANNVLLISQSLSVTIRYTGYFTTTTVGSRYRATQCGLCGNFDGCPENEFTGPSTTCQNMLPTAMTKAYIVREGNCAGVGSTTCQTN